MQNADTSLLISFLSTHDSPCPVCSYNLRNLQTANCPECGSPLHLQVGSENLRIGPWLLATFSLTMAVGFDAVVSLVLLTGILFFFRPRSPGDLRQMEYTIGTFLGLTLVCGAGIFFLLRKRRQWCLLSRRSQWRIAAAIFATVFAFHLVVGGVLTRIL